MTTTTLCIPSSCIATGTCGSSLQQTSTAHQIARAALLYGVSEIVVYSIPEVKETSATEKKKIVFGEEETRSKQEEYDEDSLKLAGLLQFFITPSYLRKLLFNDLKSFQHAKKLTKLPGLPFLNHSKGRYLEGMAIPAKIQNKKMAAAIKKKNKTGSMKSKKEIAEESSTGKVNVGNKTVIDLENQTVPVGSRVTVDIIDRKVVSPSTAYGSDSFGYTVRIARNFGKVFTESIYPDGYTFSMYIPSEEFTKHGEIELKKVSQVDRSGHTLLVYGKWTEVQRAVEQDRQELEAVTNPESLFDGRLDVQRGARTEDVVMISLARLGEGVISPN